VPTDKEPADKAAILEIISPGSKVLEVGCGDGSLLALLARERRCKVRGIDNDSQAVRECVARGLSVLQGDLDASLADYGSDEFDYVVLNQSIPHVREPEKVLAEAIRVGRKTIVAFPNFAHYSARWQLFYGGRAPVTASLPFQWFNTPNLHFLSISDFQEFCRKKNFQIEQVLYVDGDGAVRWWPNLRAQIGIFVLTADALP
jgi:methionine biosynthesis protein MetW